MVKPEYKTTDKAQVVAMKEPLDKELPEDDESVSFDGIRHRHRPPVCTFMVLLILVLLAGFLAVYFVDKWKSNRYVSKKCLAGVLTNRLMRAVVQS